MSDSSLDHSSSHPPISDPLPENGRVAGIDFGTVRIGIAISDPTQTFSTPLVTYTRRSAQLDALFFQTLVEQEQLVGFVVGLPVHMSGDASAKSKQAVEFGKWLKEQSGTPVAWIDERYTTAMARDILNQTNLSGKKRKAKLDKIAAQILLAAYLESGTSRVLGIE